MSDTKKPQIGVRVIKAQEPQPIIKSDVTTQVNDQEAWNNGDWISAPVFQRGLKAMVNDSTILPQCIRAYKNNIAGFGIGVRYREDVEETKEMADEYDRMKEIIELLNTEEDTKEVFEDLIEARETYGISYLEVIRNLGGDVVQIEFVENTPSIDMTKPLDPYIETPFYHHGQETMRKKRFRKYRQQLGGKTVYFKEFGDPRVMDNLSGEYAADGAVVPIERQANELLAFTIGTMPYGEVRWIGQVLGVDGSRRAESLNNNYFINGRHTPLMILVQNGTLSDESFERLQHYINDIKGENGQHAFMVLETEATDGRTDFESSEKPTVEIKDLASILQKDELFQDYLDNHRRKVQSAFQLPDLYVGYTTDFNRATAQTAQEVTEQQVFQPERKSLAWVINNRLLNGYNFKYVEAYFLEPNISNPDDMYKMLTVLNNAGGLSMNKAKELTYKLYGEVAEDYDAEWGNLPLQLARATNGGAVNGDLLQAGLEQQITKASAAHDDAVVAVMKEVRALLIKAQQQEGGAGGNVQVLRDAATDKSN